MKPATNHDELSQAGVTELSALISAKHLSPVELVRLLLDRIERSQPALNAFITVCADGAIRDAKEAEAAVMRGEALGPLHGIPFSVKDTIPTRGVRTTYGSLICLSRNGTALMRRRSQMSAERVNSNRSPHNKNCGDPAGNTLV